MKEKSFLTHLGGLRGLAIILVILFHLNAAVFPQGYLGVDVFLVISGYLLFRNRQKRDEALGLKDTLIFAWRRVQRIVAPMCIIVLLTLVAGLFFLLPEGELFSCKLGETSCLGRANTLLAREMANYFAQDADYTPLLHLWYLSVILQVYLIFAVGNYALQRLPKYAVISILSVVGIASLALRYSFPIHEWLQAHLFSTWEQTEDVSYYATLPRLWEVLAGGLVCILPSFRHKFSATVVSLLGLLGILAFGFASLVPGGSILAEMPVQMIVALCTVLVIRYLPEGYLNAALSNRPLMWLGGISFSVYLVHMPLFVFWRLWNYGVMGWGSQSMIILISIGVGWGFWWCVEKRRMPWWLIVLLWTGAYAASRTGRKTEGYKEYMPFSNTSGAQVELPKYTDWKMCEDPVFCDDWDNSIVPRLNIFGYMGAQVPQNMKAPFLIAGDAAAKPSIVLMGDSYGMHAYPGLDAVLKQEGKAAIYMALNVYTLHNVVLRNRDASYNYSPEKQKAIMDWLRAHPDLTHVIIGQRWEQKFIMAEKLKKDFESLLRSFVQDIRDTGKQVILIGPTPLFGVISPAYKKISLLRGDPASAVSPVCTLAQYMEKNKDVMPILRKLEKEGLFTILDPCVMLQPGDVFKAIDSQGNMLMMDKEGHFSVEGSKQLMQALLPQLRNALK